MKRIAVVPDNIGTDSESSWQEHVSSILSGYIDASNLQNQYNVTEYQDLTELRNEILNKKFNNGDKVIFTNAWAGQVVFVRHWAETAGLKLEYIGMWNRASYLDEDLEYKTRFKRGKSVNRGWRNIHEYSMHRTLTKNLFMKQSHKDKFQLEISRSSRKSERNKFHCCGFPLEYLDVELSGYSDTYYKQRHIFFPYSEYSSFQERILYDMLRTLPDVQILFSRDRSAFTRHQKLSFLTKSKVAYLPYSSPNIGKEIYECTLLDTIPFVPDFKEFRDMVPSEFRYPIEWTKNIMSYSRYGAEFIKRIEDLVDNYDLYLPLLQETRSALQKNYYDSESFIKQIFDN